MPADFGAQWPPEVQPQWIWTAFLAAAAFGVAVRSSVREIGRRVHIVAGIAMGWAILNGSQGVAGYYRSFHDFPWGWMGLAALILILGTLIARQYVVGGVLLATLGAVFSPALIPPSAGFPSPRRWTA